MIRKPLIVGGNSGIGLAIALRFLKTDVETVYIVGKDVPKDSDIPDDLKTVFAEKVTVIQQNFVTLDMSVFEEIKDIDALMITAGFGRVALFEDLTDVEISNLLKVNLDANVQIIKQYYDKIQGKTPFYTAVMVSICGQMVSPFFSVYGAAKGGLRFLIENLNCELQAKGCDNRILDVSPGSLKGTAFNGGENDLTQVDDIAAEVIARMMRRETLYIPQYDELYRGVLDRYYADPVGYGQESYQYKVNSGRISDKSQVTIGYLSGTFDLFHIGHLNLLKRAKEQCDYLVVGVHNSGAWKGKETFIPFEERCKIVGAIQYVDKVVEAPVEDSDAWDLFHYNKLFVGSDYKGTERFKRYEEMFKDKVEIVYFPYTKGTSSTQLRDALSNKNKDK